MKSFRQFREAHDADEGIVLQTVPLAARGMQGERAGFFTRLIAVVIDVVIVGAIMIGIWTAAWLFLLVFDSRVEYGMPRPGYFVLGGYFLLWLYWTWGWATNGRSVGQGLMGVRVLDRNDRFPSWKLAALRAAFCVIFPLGIAWILVSRTNRSVQDVVVRTSVIHDWSSAASSDLLPLVSAGPKVSPEGDSSDRGPEETTTDQARDRVQGERVNGASSMRIERP